MPRLLGVREHLRRKGYPARYKGDGVMFDLLWEGFKILFLINCCVIMVVGFIALIRECLHEAAMLIKKTKNKAN